MTLTSEIKNFSEFLNISWAFVQGAFIGEDGQDVTDDWFQANWELLVERTLGVRVFLEVYGNGADCYGASSRITFNKELPSHYVICNSKTGNPLQDILNKEKIRITNQVIIFDRLVTITDNGWYDEIAPFDKVLCFIDNRELVFSLNDLEFDILKTSKCTVD